MADTYAEWEDTPEGQAYLAAETDRQKAYEAEKALYEKSLKEQEESQATEEYVEVEEDNGAEDEESSAPAKSASKVDWVAYAVEQGADEEEANSLTKDDLIAAYGG